jgi:hypothetical protein
VFACPAAAYTGGAEKYLMRDSRILAGTTATYMPGVGHKRVLERGMNRDEGRTYSQRPGFEGTGTVCSSQVQTEKYELQKVKETYAEGKNLNQDVALGMTLETCASLHTTESKIKRRTFLSSTESGTSPMRGLLHDPG